MILEEKIRLFNGVGSWKTFTADGKIPGITMSDGPHGLRKQNGGSMANINNSIISTCFPTASCVASSWDVNVLEQMGRRIAFEALKEDVQLMLGPGLNIKRSPLCGRNFEYFSEDPYLSGMLAAAYVNGMQNEGVGSCIKHFACNNQESLRQSSSSNVDERTLREIYLRGFEIAVKKSNPAAVMCSYNKINRIYAAQNHHLLTEILKDEWKYEGAVISDWGACIDAAKSIKAGLDLAMPDSSGYFENELKQEIENGNLLEKDLDKANSRVIALAEKLTKMRQTTLGGKIEKTFYVDNAAQHKAALDFAFSSAVLLKNEDFLPLEPQVNKKIVVIGELAEKMRFQGGGSSHVNTQEFPNAIASLEKCGFTVEYSKGYDCAFTKKKNALKKNAVFRKNAVDLVRKSTHEKLPVLIFCGLTDFCEGEGFDRPDMNIPVEQRELVKQILELTDNVAIISFSGSPIDLSFCKNAKSILHMYLCGEACGEACAKLISGEANPSGKLAETWPISAAGEGVSKVNVDYTERLLVGYRYYCKNNVPVQFAFGFGLSYTTFAYSNLKLIEKEPLDDGRKAYKLSFEIQNTGKRAGAEVCQVYVNKELRGFAKTYLEPNEVSFVEIELDENAFSSFSVEKNKFVQVAGAYLVQVCSNINDVRLVTSVNVTGENAPLEENALFKHVHVHHKGRFDLTDSLGVMAKESNRVRMFMKLMLFAVRFINRGKSKDDPSVKIALCAIRENPLVSLVTSSGGAISPKFAQKLVKWANL